MTVREPTLTRLAGLVLCLSLLAGCGGASASAPEDDAATAERPMSTTATTDEASMEQPASPPPVEASTQPDERIFYVVWDGIHVLTIYPQAGPIRGEEDDSPHAVFGTDSEHFSVVSHYYEREDMFGPMIEAATSLEDLLDRFRAMELVEIREDINPIYQDQY